MNPRVLNPDPLSILKEANKIYDPSKTPGMRDGFTIIDGNRAKGAGWASDAAYNDSISKNFDYTANDFTAAKNRAAREGLPLVVVVGNKNSADTKQLVDGVIPGAKGGANKAIYVYAEMSKLDPSSELGREVSAARGDANHPYTAIFAPKAGADGSPQLEHHIANTWGSRAEIASIIQTQVGSAQTTMESRKGTFKVPDAPTGEKPLADGSRGAGPSDATPRPEAKREATEQEKLQKLEADAEARLGPDARTIIDSFKKLKGANYSDRETLYKQAEEAAARVNPQDVALVKQKTAREFEAETAKGDAADSKKLETLQARQQVLDLMANAPSWTKISHGVSQLRYSQLDKGIANITDGGKLNPAYMNNPQFIEELLKTPYDVSKLKEKLPEVKFDEYLQHKKAGTIDQFVAAQKAAEVKPESTIKPEATPVVKPEARPEVPTPPAKPETALVQPEKLKYDGADYEKSLEDAYKSGRMVVAKVGSPDCTGCVDMTKNAWPDKRVEQALHDKAVFTDINGENRMDLVESLPADSWPTVLVIEPYKDEATGKILGRVASKIVPHSAEARSADSLNKFLTDNLRAPIPQVVAKPEAKPTVTPGTKPEVTPEVTPAAKPGVTPEAKPVVTPEVPPTPEPEVKPESLPETKPDAAALEAADKATFERLTANHRKILEPLRALNPQSDAATIETAFNSAIKSAQEVKPQDIQRANQVLEERKQTIKASIIGGEPDEATSAELKKIEADQNMIRRIDQFEAYLNISKGAVKLKMNPDQPEAGKADIAAGLKMRPELANDAAAHAKLRGTGFDDATLKSWFPELPFSSDAKPEAPGAPPAKDPAKVFERLNDQYARNLQPFADLPEQPTEEQMNAAYIKAIDAAKQVDPADVQLALTALSARRDAILAAAKGGQLSEAQQVELQQIGQDGSNYMRIGQADGLLYVSMGARKMSAQGADQAYIQEGIDDVHRGLALRPELRTDPAVAQKLASTGFDRQKLAAWFPELGQEQLPKPQPGPEPGPQPGPQPGRPNRPPSRK